MKLESPFYSPFRGEDFSMDDGPQAAWTLVEWEIFEFSKAIRGKPNWHLKLKDPEIRARWRREMEQQLKFPGEKADIADYVFDELEWYVQEESKLPNSSGFFIGLDPLITVSDSAVPSHVHGKLVEQAKKLRESFEEPDYHPGLDQLVIDLVHPSLYPVVYSKTQCLRNGKFETIEKDPELISKKPSDYGDETSFQWLPALMKWDGKYVFSSYINNLKPSQFKELYGTIEDIFNAALPGINHTLTRYASPIYRRVPIPALIAEADPEQSADEDESKLNHMEPYRIRFREPKTTPYNLGDKALKVIVKMADIELTPEKPLYPGGLWHLEGTLSEDIVATVLYYYDVENIKDSELSFRKGLYEPYYEQYDAEYLEKVFGIIDEEPIPSVLGSEKCTQGRVLVFPNVLQHHVEPFELLDKLTRGHRRILCFFLVDPEDDAVYTTADVPPQQADWESETCFVKESYHMTYEEALKEREKLIDERKALGSDKEGFSIYGRKPSLCEH